MVDAAKLSAHERQRGLLQAFASIVLVSIAQLLMKYAMSHVTVTDEILNVPLKVISELSLVSVLLPLAIGMMCYGISVVCWMGALARLPLSLAYPLLSLSYPLVYLGAILLPVFHETVNLQRFAAIALIMLGVALLMIEQKS